MSDDRASTGGVAAAPRGLRVLVVDDERVSRATTVQQLERAGYCAAAAASAQDALERIAREPWDVVVTDLRMPGMDGLELLRRVRDDRPDIDVVLMTAYGTVEAAVDALQHGAADFLTKPFSFRVLEARLRKLAELRGTRRELHRVRDELRAARGLGPLIGRSAAMVEVRERVGLFARHDLPVLVTGETGTGKELVARAIHEASPRAAGPFVAVGCGTIPRELAESELFGHERGAFTGATGRRAGAFERADGGTLLLDDIDDLPADIQVKLLRVLQDGRFSRVGGEREMACDVRVVATTKIDLERAAAEGRFRPDLYYRLRTLELRLPALRERRDDIPLLAAHFLAQIAARDGRDPPPLADDAAAALIAAPWPGNVRELRGAIEGAYVLARGGPVEAAHLPASVRGGAAVGAPFALHLDGVDRLDMPAVVRAFEHALIDWALDRAGGSQARAAELLGLPRTTLQSKLSSR
ncbi:MAG: sigma-54-dependent Fis family transcriptional regulator [Deltaproteobacteria bacterium]|nr:MAG: sigma-54-dependent Fis family transcriptional regulator [Deltaproteobacteria bacterium]